MMDRSDRIGVCQWRYALVDGIKTDILDAQKGVPGLCPLCGQELRPRKGETRGWHWYHVEGRKCDAWYEPKGIWHRWWQDQFNKEWQEVSISKIIDGDNKKHIADILSDENVVIEFQYSHLSVNAIREREEFYGSMLWVVNGTRLDRDRERGRLFFRDSVFEKSDDNFDWGVLARDETINKVWDESTKLVFWDFDGTFENPVPDGYLYCLLPGKTIDEKRFCVRIRKEQLVDNGRSGRLNAFIEQILSCKTLYNARQEAAIAERRRRDQEERERVTQLRQEADERRRQQNERRCYAQWKADLENPAQFAIDCGWAYALLIIRRRLKFIDLNRDAMNRGLSWQDIPDCGLLALHLKQDYSKAEYDNDCKLVACKYRAIAFPPYEDLRKCAGCIVVKFYYVKTPPADDNDHVLAIDDITPLRNYDDTVRFVWYVADRNGIWQLTDELVKAVNDRKYKQTKFPRCPVCGAKMQIRENKIDGTKFLGCTTFPKCKGTFSLDENGISCSESSRLYWRYLSVGPWLPDAKFIR